MSDIVILTGAGISAESGLKTFRDSDGLWENERIEDVATPDGFERNPDRVYKFYNERRHKIFNATPNPAHYALAKLEKIQQNIIIVTQNIDTLHEKAGSKKVIHMHGQIDKAFCKYCNHHFNIDYDIDITTKCPHCHKMASIRPDIVWFGEVPYSMEEIEDKIMRCMIFISIGTSGNVYPASSFVMMAKQVGAHTVLLNKEHISNNNYFNEHIIGNASEIVPQWVENYISKH